MRRSVGRIVVFDSGLGSLSLIGPIRESTRAEIIYLADRRSYPYGAKSRPELRRVVEASIETAREAFSPDVIVVGSNTPSLLVPEVLGRRVIGVLPPVRAAARASKTHKIAVLATRSAARSAELARHIQNQTVGMRCSVARIDASKLVDLAETAKFVTRRALCARIIHKTLAAKFARGKIDAATLSSTHLPLLRPILQDVFPNVAFFDPARSVAKRAARLAGLPSRRATLRVYTTGGTALLQKQLARMGYACAVTKI